MPHDAFLSYNSQDHEAVTDIARKLHERGVSCFLDRWYLPKGQPWRSLLEENLAKVRSVIVFIGPNGMGPWQHREIDVALDMQAKTAGFPVIPILLPGSEPPLGFLRQNTWIDRRNLPLDQVVLLLEKSVRGEPPGPDLEAQFAAAKNSICPYRGLLYFREEDAPFFFGRNAAIDGLQKAVEKSNFLAVVGASGCGKSSVARAGLVPRLRKDRQTIWEIASLVPGDEPLKALAAAIVPFLFPELDPIDRRAKANKLAAAFADGLISLRDMVRDVLERQTGTQRLLLVADQWEELYTLTKDDTQRRRFVDELLDASTRAPLRVVLTLRGDFVGSALAYRPLSDRLQGSQVNLGPMNAEELQLAIRNPAREVGLEFQIGLSERILDDVGEEPGHLPLLEFVLRELWDKRQGGKLLHDAYDRMGGLHGAVAAKAEALFEKLSPPEQEAARRLFLRLVHAAEERNDTRRRELLRDIPESSHDLVRHMADERLLVTGGSSESGGESVEVAHEALIRNWKRLAGWLNANREFLLWRERLRALLEEWKRGERNEELLLRVPVLGEAERWLLRQGEALVEDEKQFIQQSIRAQHKREEEQRLQQERERVAAEEAIRARKDASRQLAEVNWQLAQQARGLPFAASEISPIKATWQLLRAAQASQDAGQMADRDNAALAAQASSAYLKATLMHGGGVNGILQSADGRRILTWSFDGTVRLWEAADGQPVGQPMQHGKGVTGAMFSADQKRILTWSFDGPARLWEAADGRPVGQPMQHEKGVWGAVFSADQKRILTWSFDGPARLWEAADGRPVGQPMQHEKGVRGAVFSADQKRILTWSEDGTARLWEAADGRPVGQPMQHEKGGLGAVFSADQKRILTWSGDGTARLWDAADGQPVGQPMQHEKGVWGVRGAVFSADQKRILTWSEDGTARLWEAADGQPVGQPMQHGKSVWGAVFSTDQRRILTWSEDGTARLWEAADGRGVGQPMQHEKGVRGAVFSTDQRRILTWSEDGTARLWEAADGRGVGQPMQHEKGVRGAVFSADQQLILTCSSDGTARLWEAADGRPVGQPMQYEKGVRGAVFSADQRRILTWSEDGTARLWEAADGQPVGQPMQHEKGVRGAVFSADQQLILTCSSDGTARLWEAADGRPVGQPMQHEKGVSGAVFSADQKRILTWSFDGTARLWNAADGRPVGQPMQHEKGVWDAEFSADQQRILTRSEDGTARLWSAGNQALITVFPHPGTNKAMFDASVQRVLTASKDGTARLWNVSFDPNIPIEELILEFEVRSATNLGADGIVHVLSEKEWAAKRQQWEAVLQKRRGSQ